MNRKILSLALPNIVTNVTIPLLAMIDLGLMGHMGSEIYVGAIAIGGMIFSFLFWGFGFLRMGTSGFTAQAYGSRNLGEASGVLSRGIITALTAGILLILLQLPIEWIAFSLIKGSSEVEELAMNYFRIRIYAAPATLVIYTLTGWFIGMQNARIPMVLALSVNTLNVALSLVFIRIFGWGSDGVAWANVVSQYTGLLLGTYFVIQYAKKRKLSFRAADAFDRTALRTFFHVNKDIFIRTLCLIFTLSFFTVQSAGSGDTMLAVNTLLFQFLYFFSYFADGFAYAAEALTGKYIGARNATSLRKAIRLIFIWTASIALLFTLAYFAGGNLILELLTNEASVLSAARPYLFWTVLIPAVSAAAFVWDGVFVGATASVAMRNSMVIITVFIFLPAYYLLHPVMGNHGLWLAMVLFMGARGIFLSALSRRSVFGNINDSASKSVISLQQ